MKAKDTEKENIDNTEIQDMIYDFFMESDSVRIRMIEWKRDFIKQVILLSAWIIAFSIPILNNWGLVNRKCLFLISQILFVLLIIIGIYHFYWINKQEDKLYKSIISPFLLLDRNTTLDKLLSDLTTNTEYSLKSLPKYKNFEIFEKITMFVLTWWFIVWLIILVVSLFA